MPGSTWGQPGVNMGSTWGQPGVNLGSTWGQPGVNLGSTGDQPGVNVHQLTLVMMFMAISTLSASYTRRRMFFSSYA